MGFKSPKVVLYREPRTHFPTFFPRLAIETFLLPRIVVAPALATEVSQYLGIPRKSCHFFSSPKKGAQTPPLGNCWCVHRLNSYSRVGWILYIYIDIGGFFCTSMSNIQCWENVGFQCRMYITCWCAARIQISSYLYCKRVPISGNNGFKFKHAVGEKLSSGFLS